MGAFICKALPMLVCALASAPAPTPADAATRIAAVGDIACDPTDPAFNDGRGTADRCRQAATARLLEGRGLDAILLLGDTQYESATLPQYGASFEPTWGRFFGRLRPAIGNHEYATPAASGYFDYFNGIGKPDGRAGRRGSGWYSFDLGRWHLVALNSNCSVVGCGRGSLQYRWLRRDLRRSKRRCTLAYWHQPRFSSGEHGNNERLAPIWRLLVRDRAELALTAHDHNYERFGPLRAGGKLSRGAGVRELVVGTGGKSLRPTGTPEPHSRRRISHRFGVLIARLRRGGAKLRFVAAPGGRTRDSTRVRCR